ncbi:MAG: glycosyltransferase [Gemmatimonadales bacterium]
MNDVRWFAPNRYCTLPATRLEAMGFTVALEGEAPARLALAADGECAVAAYEWAHRHGVPLGLYVWDLPPWRLGRGRPDLVLDLGGRLRTVPSPLLRYPGRPGHYSRLRFVARRAAAVWCPSSQTAADLAARFGVRAAVVPFCYDSDRFTRDSAPERPWKVALGRAARPIVLAVSRLVPHKNHAALIRAAAGCLPKPLVRLVGRGPEAPGLRALARDLGVPVDLEDRWATDEEVLRAYRAADLVVAISRFEGFGLTPLEALACGVPVVASDIPPHREALGARVGLVPLDDPAALIDAMGTALRTPPDRVPEPPVALTIDACAARFRDRLLDLLGRVA